MKSAYFAVVKDGNVVVTGLVPETKVAAQGDAVGGVAYRITRSFVPSELEFSDSTVKESATGEDVVWSDE